MNARCYLQSHPVILRKVLVLRDAGIDTDEILRIIDDAISSTVTSRRDREEIRRVLLRALKAGSDDNH